MAVAEEECSSTKSRSASNNDSHYLAKCVLKGSVVLHVVHGRIRSPSFSDIVFGKVFFFFSFFPEKFHGFLQSHEIFGFFFFVFFVFIRLLFFLDCAIDCVRFEVVNLICWFRAGCCLSWN